MLLRTLEKAACRHGLAGQRVLVAVSGGVDSTVLLHALRACAGALRLTPIAGHVNHGLRGPDSDADETGVRDLAAKLELPVLVARADPRELRRDRSSRLRPTLQEAARRVRYDALAGLATQAAAERIATAHTADDQAETVLLRLLRGTGPDGLGGIPERSPDGRIVRPLLGVTRAEILAYARGRSLHWREDASNQRPAFARARLRARWLPGLAADFNPRLLRALADLAEAQRRDSEWIEGVVEQEASRRFAPHAEGLRITRDGWDELPEALARRLARVALRSSGAGREVARVHLLRMLDFLRDGRTGSRIELPNGLELHAERDAFWLRPAGVQVHAACYARRHSRKAVPRGTGESTGENAGERLEAGPQGMAETPRQEST